MAKQFTTRAAPNVLGRAPTSRARRLEAIFGRDWKVALPFVLPMVVIMAVPMIVTMAMPMVLVVIVRVAMPMVVVVTVRVAMPMVVRVRVHHLERHAYGRRVVLEQDVRFQRGDAALVDAVPRQRVAAYVQLGELLLDIRPVRAEIDEGRERHVPGQPGEAIEI